MNEADRLVEQALFLCTNGERPPGAPPWPGETWGEWARRAEAYLRSQPADGTRTVPIAPAAFAFLIRSFDEAMQAGGLAALFREEVLNRLIWGDPRGHVDVEAKPDETTEVLTQWQPAEQAHTPEPAPSTPVFGADSREIDPATGILHFPLLSLCTCGRQVTKFSQAGPWQHC